MKWRQATPYTNTMSGKKAEGRGALAGIQSHEAGKSQSHGYSTAHR